MPVGTLDVRGIDSGYTAGDLVVDSVNKNVYVGRLSSTSGNNDAFTVRDRFGSSLFVVNTAHNGVGNAISYFDGTSLGINTTSPIAMLDVRANVDYSGAGTLPVASISGKTSFANMVVDNSGTGDLFTASSAGLSRFVITQAGNVGYWHNVPRETARFLGRIAHLIGHG